MGMRIDAPAQSLNLGGHTPAVWSLQHEAQAGLILNPAPP